jgi:hypothetical protein
MGFRRRQILTFLAAPSVLGGCLWNGTVSEEHRTGVPTDAGANLASNGSIHTQAPQPLASVWTIPAAGSSRAAVGDGITVQMSAPVDETTVSADSVYLETGGKKLPTTVQVKNTALVITPAEDLAYGTPYTVTVRQTVKSKTGLVMAGDLTTSFSTLTGDAIRAGLPIYYDFLKSMIDRGFECWDFSRYYAADKSKLPPKLLVIRHDIHQHDAPPGYDMYAIEHYLLPHDHAATYYVMLNHPDELNADGRRPYLKIIDYLMHRRQPIDIQPHISPWEMYISQKKPAWAALSATDLEHRVKGSYQIVRYDDGVEIKAVGPDFLELDALNADLKSILIDYNKTWTKMTGLEVRSYAAHGTPVAANHTDLNGAVMLDQRSLLAAGIYDFDAYNTKIFKVLTYLSDNYSAPWMFDPSSIKDGRYEFLSHPYVWKAAVRPAPAANAVTPPAAAAQTPQSAQAKPKPAAPSSPNTSH